MKKYQIILAAVFIAIFLAAIFWSAGAMKISEKNEWNLFTDIVGGWEIEYPKEATSINIADDLNPEVIESVIFGKKESGFWFFDVQISKSNLVKIEDFVTNNSRPDLDFLKYIEIDGVKTAVFDDSSGYKIRTVFFLKGERLFGIKTNGNILDEERVWKSFHFL